MAKPSAATIKNSTVRTALVTTRGGNRLSVPPRLDLGERRPRRMAPVREWEIVAAVV
jgi:hypothetical protein